jgi:hypothetical protein
VPRETSRRTYIERWEVRARVRRENLERELARPVDSLGALRTRNWIRRVQAGITARKAWLEARLRHVSALETIVNSAIHRDEAMLHPASATTRPPFAASAGAPGIKAAPLQKVVPAQKAGLAPHQRGGGGDRPIPSVVHPKSSAVRASAKPASSKPKKRTR